MSWLLWLWWLLACSWSAVRRQHPAAQRAALAGVGVFGVVGVLALIGARQSDRPPVPEVAPAPAEAPPADGTSHSDAGGEPATSSAVSGRRICLDPGHGGADPGTIFVFENGYTLRESDVVLDIALTLTQRLQAQGAHVILTRQTDQALELVERAEYCNAANAELAMSIHFNGVDDPTINGALALHGKASDEPLAEVMAGVLQRGLFDHQQTEAIDFGARHFGARVLLYATMPAVLVEPAFLTHPDEAQALLTPAADPTSRRTQIVGELERGLHAYLQDAGNREQG